MAEGSQQECLHYFTELVKGEMEKGEPNIVPISVALGALESALTDKRRQHWPANLQEQVQSGSALFEDFVKKAAAKIADAFDTKAKVKAVADLVWTHLTGVFSKDIHHVQHIHSFAQILGAPKQQSKRQLDCAGVVTSVLAACWQLSHREQHADLASCRLQLPHLQLSPLEARQQVAEAAASAAATVRMAALQVSEDHCWINFDPDGGRGGTVEVTTDTAAKRGQAVGEEAWKGWLYTGGHAVLCSPKMTVAALVTSLNPSINARQTTGTDSEEVNPRKATLSLGTQLQQIQHDLLQCLYQQHREAMYPAALCTLADLIEIYRQDELQSAVLANEREGLCSLLDRRPNDAHALFEEAIDLSQQQGSGAGRCWYPYSYKVGYSTRRAQFILKDAIGVLGEEMARERGDPLLRAALRWCGSGLGAAVLRHYRYTAVDEQLHKDVEGVLEMACRVLEYLHKRQPGGGEVPEPSLLVPLLEFWDGICWYWSGKPKPSSWVGLLIKTAKMFSQEARQQAVATAVVSSQVMLQASDLWRTLKPSQIRPLFEAADVASDGQRGLKRARGQ